MRLALLLPFLGLLLPWTATPAAAADLDALAAEADSDHWRTRWKAARGFAALHGDEAVFKVRGMLLRDPRARVRSAVAWACLLEPSLGNATLLGLALKKDKDPAVRRAAARALIHFKDRRAVGALVDAFATETDLRARLHIVEALRTLTPAPCLLEGAAWNEWWNLHRKDPSFRPADAAPSKAEYDGILLETRTVAAIPRKKGDVARKPPHVLVLPQFGWTTASFGPSLLPLREHAAITWVRLPTVQRLTGRSGFGGDVATYPVARLVRSLEAFRAALKIDRFIILANGASGWIAMRYAVTHPKQCAGLVLIDTALDSGGYASALSRGAARGTSSERWIAKTLMRQNNVPLNESTLNRMHAMGIEKGFDDAGDLEIAWMYHRAREPQGFATVPEIKWRRHRKVEIPSLFFYSAASAFSGHREAGRIQKHFTRSLVAPVNGARALPYIEHNEKFHEVVLHFLDRFELR